jgi:aerobic-type carbon monoxide dehydrogenase small subunit (CoxS/CutS family)
MQDIGYHRPTTISELNEHLSHSEGRVLVTKAPLESYPQPTDQEIREGLSGNLYRYTGYNKMVDAIHQVIKEALDG